MKAIIITLLSLILFYGVGGKNAHCLDAFIKTQPIKVVRFLPTPNYKLCTDPNDESQLTDGRIERYPIWSKPGCVGWEKAGIVKILIETESDFQQQTFGKIRIHTVKGDYADVAYPAFITVYSGNNVKSLNFLAEKRILKEVKKKEDKWIDISLNGIGSTLLVVVHAMKDFIFIDEIILEEQRVSEKIKKVPVGDITACERDSVSRRRVWTQKELTEKLTDHNHISKQILNLPEDLVIWTEENPYAELSASPPLSSLKREPILNINGFKSEKEPGCVGVFNQDNIPHNYKIILHGSNSVIKAIKTYNVKPILAADEKVVFDPIELIDHESNSFEIPALRVTYLWFDFDLRRIEPGTNACSIELIDIERNKTKSVPIQLHVSPLRLDTSKEPYAVNWGYTDDLPIYKNQRKGVVDNLQHGINTFVIHSKSIPMPRQNNKWDYKRAALLEKEINNYRQGRLILLFLNWGGNKGLRPLIKKHTPEIQKKIIQNWAIQISQFFKRLKISNAEWALYPWDEPTGDNNLFDLLNISKWIKEANHKIQIYANPSSTPQQPTTTKSLKQLLPYVNFWQPRYRLGKQHAAFFNDANVDWWIYSNPPSPAKSASPWSHYRLMALRAWVLGAKGIGFWSYSDTTGSSAWDDFDGLHPDYAVVYESKNGQTSSRRWEAFRDGIEDFKLLEATVNDENKKTMIMKVNEILNSPDNSYNIFKEFRNDILLNTKD